MGALLTRGGAILSVGWNTQHRHAEIETTRNVDCRKATIYVYRETKINTIGMARPCEKCYDWLVELGVKRVFYTIPEEPYWKMERL